MPKTIAIVGPESSGKTSLSSYLSNHLSEPLAEEYARNYLEKTSGIYTQQDLVAICQGQIHKIEEATKSAKQFLFTDTEPFSIRVWSELKYKSLEPELEKISDINPNYFYLLCSPDLNYQADHLRESPELKDRKIIFNHFLKALEGRNNFLGIVKGIEKDRENSALQILKTRFSSYF